MAETKFTLAQQQALDVSGRNVLVSAAAGSGKTFTLTKRIIKNILEREADISRILVVTFTRAATNELKSRISAAIMDEIAKNPDNIHLQNQMLLLGQADVCTIDSFLSRPVKENFDKLGLPVSMRIADEAEMRALSQNILEEVMDSLYARYGVCDDGNLAGIDLTSPLTDLLALLATSSKDSSEIIPFLTKLHSKLITLPRGVELLRDFSQRLYADAEKDFLCTREGQRIIEELSSVINGALEFYNVACSVAATDEVMVEKYLPTFEEDKSQLIAISEHLTDNLDELLPRLNAFPRAKIGSLKSGQKTPESIRLHESRNEIIKQIKSIVSGYLSYDKEELRAAYKKTSQITEVLYTLLSEYDRRLCAEKLSRGIYEFSDMPRFMIKLLQNEDGSPSEAAKIISQSYDEIYIDEYQDVNEIQDSIFALIGPHNRFMVGDVKQSIYCFRDAEPKFFSAYRRAYPIYDPDSEDIPNGSTILMSNNFRSDKNVIDFSNTVCAPMFRACGKAISYTSADDLAYTKKRPEGYISPKVCVDIFGKGDPTLAAKSIPWANIDDKSTPDSTTRDDGLDEEAVFVTNKIAELIRTGKRADGNPIKPGDIAILVRKNKSVPVITAALRRANIKYLLSSNSELLQSRDMTLLVELLSIIDNPRQDVPLCSVLECDLLPESLRFGTGELITIRRHGGKKLGLYDAIKLYGEDGEGDPLDTMLSAKCRSLTHKLKALRSLSVRLAAEEFLRVLASDEAFSEFCDGDSFRYLYDSACKYTRSTWNSLSGFVRYFANIIENGSISGEARPDESAVNIVTMHSSKGLQYNTCFLFDCGLLFRPKELEKPIIYDKELCVGTLLPYKEPGEINTKRLGSIIYDTVSLDVRSRLLQEEMRILYVALTRAEERLFVSGTIGGNATFKSFFEKYNLYGISDISTIYQPSLLGWVVGAMHIDGHDKSTYEVTLHSILNNTPLCEPFESKASETAKADSQVEKYAELMSSPPSQRPEEILLSAIPSKAAASKVSDTMLDDSVFSSIPAGILFSDSDIQMPHNERADNASVIKNRIELMRSASVTFDSLIEVNKKPTAAERGTAMHAFLQYCDYKSIRENGVAAEIERLRSLDFISQRTADILNIRQLEKFFGSSFFEMLLGAKSIRREFKFGMFRPASDFTQNKELADIVADRSIFVQGSVDLLIENSDGSIYLCDYKTDRVSAEERSDPSLLQARMTELHKAQLEQYAYAIEQIFGKKPERTYILALATGDALEIK